MPAMVAWRANGQSGLGGLLLHHAALHVGFEITECLLVALHSHLQGIGQPLGCEKVDDDSLRELNGFG